MRFFLLICLLAGSSVTKENHHHVSHTISRKRLEMSQYPFFAQISIPLQINPDIQMECGGTLIDPMWILTAAHCFMDNIKMTKELVQSNKIKVYMGSNKRIAYSDDAVINFVHKVYVHPKYNRFDNETDVIVSYTIYDIALARLKYPYKLSHHIQTLYLPQLRLNKTERCKIGVIIGIDDKENKYIVSVDVYEKHRQELTEIPKPLMQTLFFTEALLNNSGGPYLCLDQNGIPVQYGIRSNENNADENTKLAIYEAVDAQTDFILHHVPTARIYKKTSWWYLKETKLEPKAKERDTGNIDVPNLLHTKASSVRLRYRFLVIIVFVLIVGM